MTQIEIIGVVALGLVTLIGLVVAITAPFNKLSEAINKLGLSVELLHHTVEGFKVIFDKQENINSDIYNEIKSLERDVIDLQHTCDLFQKTYSKNYKD